MPATSPTSPASPAGPPADPAEPAEEGGEAACWLHRICPACGAVPDGPAPASCGRCGEPLTAH